MNNLRASKMPLFFACPSSAEQYKYDWNDFRESSDLGIAMHEMAASYLMGHHVDMKSLCGIYGCQLSEAEYLQSRFIAMNDGLGINDNPNLHIEQQMFSDPISGTPDVWWFTLNTLEIIDWKFGHSKRDAYHQMAAYAYLVQQNAIQRGMGNDNEYIRARVAWVRLGEMDEYVFTSEDIDRWYREMLKRRKQIGKSYNPGMHCSLCPRYTSCVAREKWIRAGVQSIVDIHNSQAYAEDIGSSYDFFLAAEKAVSEYRKRLEHILDCGEDIKIGNGVMTRGWSKTDVIDPRIAWPILVQEFGFGTDDMARLVSIGKTRMMELARQKKGASGAHALMHRLREEGAVTDRPTKKRVIKTED